ncbi:MAG: hypothetical protein RJB39_238 [Candidatus Parcubacteria bacterium]|jgi:hypothetical protein
MSKSKSQSLTTILTALQEGGSGTSWAMMDYKPLLPLAKQFPDHTGRFTLHHIGVICPNQRAAHDVVTAGKIVLPPPPGFKMIRIGGGPNFWTVGHIPEPRLNLLLPCATSPSYLALGWSASVRVFHWYLDVVVDDGYEFRSGTNQYKTLPTRYPENQPLPCMRMTDGTTSVFFRRSWAATPPETWGRWLAEKVR